MLIVDDCSTDRSAEIIQTYVKRDLRLNIFRTDHPSGSLRCLENIAIKNKRKVVYCFFLDSDDSLPSKLEETGDFYRADLMIFIYSDYEKWRGMGSGISG